jgi:hypothetical protein
MHQSTNSCCSFLERRHAKSREEAARVGRSQWPNSRNKLARPSLLFARRKPDKAIVVLRHQTSERDTQLTNHSRPYFAFQVDCADAMPAEASTSAAIAQSGKHRRAMSPSPIRSSATTVYSRSNEIIVCWSKNCRSADALKQGKAEIANCNPNLDAGSPTEAASQANAISFRDGNKSPPRTISSLKATQSGHSTWAWRCAMMA